MSNLNKKKFLSVFQKDPIGVKYPRGAAGTDLFLFIVFIIVLGVVWVYTGGPERSISRSGPFLSSPLEEGGAFGLPRVDIPDISSYDGAGSSSGGTVGLETNEERSPYAEYVSLSVSNAANSKPESEYVTIKTSRSLSGTLTVSDWRLESTISKKSIALGGAVATPQYGQVNSASPLALGANATVYVTSGRSPIGVSFRTNSCTGYFEQYQDFDPRLTLECPVTTIELSRAAERDYVQYSPSPSCRSYVAGLRQCEIVSALQVPQGIEPECRNIVLNSFSYNGCVDLHRGDGDFYKNEWRIFLGQETEIWKNDRERIRLLDEAGRVIDVVSY